MKIAYFFLTILLLALPSHSYSESLESITNEAKRGNSTAQYNLGIIYCGGHGEEIDYNLAAHWFGMSANQGNYMAGKALGELYSSGRASVGGVVNHERSRVVTVADNNNTSGLDALNLIKQKNPLDYLQPPTEEEIAAQSSALLPPELQQPVDPSTYYWNQPDFKAEQEVKVEAPKAKKPEKPVRDINSLGFLDKRKVKSLADDLERAEVARGFCAEDAASSAGTVLGLKLLLNRCSMAYAKEANPIELEIDSIYSKYEK